jgi:hypothetical protein
MQPFFFNFPKTTYNNVLLVDIASRLKLTDFNWISNPSLYYDYDYQDFDTPDNIADRYYNDSTLHWLILLTNNIIDPNFDLPLSHQKFVYHLNSKYKTEGDLLNITGYEYSQSTIDPLTGYQKYIKMSDNDTGEIISENYYIIDEQSYYGLIPEYKVIRTEINNLLYEVSRRSLVTIFDIEYEKNESKRTIKILKKEFVTTAIQSLSSLLNNYNG